MEEREDSAALFQNPWSGPTGQDLGPILGAPALLDPRSSVAGRSGHILSEANGSSCMAVLENVLAHVRIILLLA